MSQYPKVHGHPPLTESDTRQSRQA